MQYFLKEFRWTGKQYNMWTNGVILMKHSSLDGIVHYSPQLNSLAGKGLQLRASIPYSKLNLMDYIM